MSMSDAHRPRNGNVSSGRRRCEFCGRPVSTGLGQSALVPDSSVIHEHDPALDGARLVVACCGAHMDQLVLRAFDAWQDGQLWFGWLCRASRSEKLRDASLIEIAEHAHLAPSELRGALAWNAAQPGSLTALPGGQRIVTN